MTYTELEIKFLRYALDTCSEGESGNAAALFFKELRKRGIKAYQFEGNGNPPEPQTKFKSGPENWDYKALYENMLVERELGMRNYTAEINLRVSSQKNAQEERTARFQAEAALAQCRQELASMQAKSASKQAKSFVGKPKQFSYWKTGCDLFHAR